MELGFTTYDVENGIGIEYRNFEEFHKAAIEYYLLKKRIKDKCADFIKKKLIDIKTIEKIIPDTKPKSIDNIMGKIQLSVAKKMFKNEIENGLITEKELKMHTQTPIGQYDFNQNKVSFDLIKRNIIKQIIANLYEKDIENIDIVKAMKNFDENKSIAGNIANIKDKNQKINKKKKKTYNELRNKRKKKEYDQIVVMIDKNMSENKKTRKIQKSLENLYAKGEMKFWNNFRKDLKTRPQINKMQQKKSKSK